MCVIQTFLSHGLKNVCITMVELNTYVIKEHYIGSVDDDI